MKNRLISKQILSRRGLRSLALILPLTLTLSYFSALKISAESGGADPGFNGGKVLTDFTVQSLEPADDVAADAAIADDGSIIVVGTTTLYIAGYKEEKTGDFVLIKYSRNGNVDTAFGNGGRVIFDFSGHRDEAQAVAIQTDGKILIGGNAFAPYVSEITPRRAEFAIARFNSNGSLDTSFGKDGKVTTDFTQGDLSSDSLDFISDIIVKPDGKFIAVGRSYQFGNSYALAMYNYDGSLDSGFGTNGKVITFDGGYATGGNCVSIQSDGKILTTGLNENGDFTLFRYTQSGALDSSFGTGGKVTTDFNGRFDSARAISVATDGKIVAAGWSHTNSDPRLADEAALARYNSNGTLDSSFGGGGKIRVAIPNMNFKANALKLQADGKIVIAELNPSPFKQTEKSLQAALPYGADLAVARFDNSKSAVICETPDITNAEVKGKKLTIRGSGFDDGSVIFVNGKEQTTSPDQANPTSVLIGKKAAKKIKPGQTVTLLVRNSCGMVSSGFSFQRSQ